MFQSEAVYPDDRYHGTDYRAVKRNPYGQTEKKEQSFFEDDNGRQVRSLEEILWDDPSDYEGEL